MCTICIYTTVRRLIDESQQFHNVKMVIFAVMFLLLHFFLFYTYIRFGKYAKYLVTTQNIIKLNRLLSRLKMLFLRTIRFSYIHENSSTAPYHLWSIFYSTQQQQHGATYCTQNRERKKIWLSIRRASHFHCLFSINNEFKEIKITSTFTWDLIMEMPVDGTIKTFILFTTLASPSCLVCDDDGVVVFDFVMTPTEHDSPT